MIVLLMFAQLSTHPTHIGAHALGGFQSAAECQAAASGAAQAAQQAIRAKKIVNAWVLCQPLELISRPQGDKDGI